MAIINNNLSNKAVNGTSSADSITNYGSKVTIKAGKGNDSISNYGGSKVSINGGAGNDKIFGYGSDVTINGGTGNDSIEIRTSFAPINGDAGDDSISLRSDSEDNLICYASGDGNDTIWGFKATDTLKISGGTYSTQESGNDVIVKVGNGTITLKDAYATTDKIRINGKATSLKRKTIKLTDYSGTLHINRDSISVVGSAKSDNISNYGDKVTLTSGKGNDNIYNDGDNVIIDAGEGDDYIINEDENATIIGGKGNDTIDNDSDSKNVLFKYTNGDGNDIIYDFNPNSTSTLSIVVGSYSSIKSGDNIIVTVGTGKISLMGAASLSKVNIKGTKATSTTKTVTNSTKSPVTVGSAVKTINASSRTKAVKITGNANANTINGGSKNDSIYGGAGNDSILGNAGNDKLYGQAGNDKLYGGKGNDTLSGGKGNDSLWGNAGKDTFIYANGDGKDVIFGFENDDMLKITGKFSTSYNKSKGEIYFKVGSTANAITLKDFSASSFNINGTNYKISGSKLVKK